MSKVTIYKGNGSPIMAIKKQRNALCSCGSGRKAKNCCGAETKYFHSKSVAEQVRSKLTI